MAQIFLDVLYSFGNCLNCFPSSPNLKINNRSYKILRLLGEVCCSSKPQTPSFSLCLCRIHISLSPKMAPFCPRS